MKNPGWVRLCFSLLFLVSSTVLFSQTNTISQRIDSLLSNQKPRPLNGVLIVAQNGKPVYSASRGFADFSTKTPIAMHDQFMIGSVSKQFTAVLVLSEFDKGNLQLHDPVKKYLPEMQQAWTDSVTIHHLLTHTSGLTTLDKPLAFKPGEKFLYSPLLAYELLSKIAEKASGKTYPELITALFRKCKMKNSTIPALYRKGHIIPCYTQKSDGVFSPEPYQLDNMKKSTPGGGIISTAKDLSLWNENLHNGKLLSQKSYALMTDVYAYRPSHRWGKVGYGYGLQISELNNQPELSHSGAMAGFISSLIYYPETKTSVVVIENIFQDFNFHDDLRKVVNAGQ